MGAVKDLTGRRFGRYMVLSFAGLRSQSNGKALAYWQCRCDCGAEREVKGSSLTSGDTSSCGCYRIERLRAKIAKPLGESCFLRVIRTYKKHAKDRGYAFQLSSEQCRELFAQPCHYCGAPPSNVKQDRYAHGTFTYSGIDRVDNEKGYSPANVVSCCHTCNSAKSDMTYFEFIEWIRRVFNKQNREVI
jgi:hypothetical protein